MIIKLVLFIYILILSLFLFLLFLKQKQFRSSRDINSSKSLTSEYQRESDYPKEFDLPEVPKFSWITDLTRSFMTAFSSFISYLLMMAVMTGNGGYFLVIICGVFVGEVAFGRFRSLRGGAGGDGHDH